MPDTASVVFQQNLETLRSATEAVSRRDREAWLNLHDRDAEFRADPDWPESETVRGREAVWDTIMSIVDAWEESPTNMVEAIDAGDDRLVAHFRQQIRGNASGVETEFDYWWVGKFRGGKIIGNYWFSDPAKALEAAGLPGLAQESRTRTRKPLP